MMEAVRTSETSVDNHSTRQYNPEDSSENDPLVPHKIFLASSVLPLPLSGVPHTEY
jgi:hypothetical protein